MTPEKKQSNLAHNLALGIIVDPEDLDLLETYWLRVYGGYARTHQRIPLHRLVHSRMIGKSVRKYTQADAVRHIVPNRLDCRRSNLFVKTGQTANQCDLNRSLNSNSTSGIHGVSWNKREKGWKVGLGYLGKRIYLGCYETKEQAARVAWALRVTRSKVTCSDVVMDYDTMKKLLKAEALKFKQQP